MFVPLLFSAGVAHAGPVMGLEWVPGGRGDLAWVDEDQLSGILVVEGDGWVDPPLSAWLGHRWDRLELVGSLGLAGTNTVTLQAAEDDRIDKTRMLLVAIRPESDLRFRMLESGQNEAWMGLGLYGVLPIVSYTSDSFTEEEQSVYDELAREDRNRILAWGLRPLVGAAHVWEGGISLGMQASWILHRAQSVDDTIIRVSWRTSAEASILLGYAF